jgi:integrase
MLIESVIKSAKPADKDYKLQDEREMYLLVHRNGGKYFRLDYRFDGKRKTLALGVYPEISLKKARELRDAARLSIKNGVDPGALKRKGVARGGATFADLFEEWVSINQAWSDKYRQDVRDRARLYLLPMLGAVPVDLITHDQLIAVIDRMKIKGIHSKSFAKVHAYIVAVYRIAIAKRICDRNLAEDVRPLLPTGSKVVPRACLGEADLPDFMAKLAAYSGKFETKIALRLLLMTATRPQETYAARWSEFDLDAALWTIPIERMKLRRLHVVPLASQVVADLRLLYEVSGFTGFLFPNQQGSGHMSENTLNLAIKKQLGFASTAHGLRATFSTVMNSKGFRADVIEVCLAHVDSSVRGVYNRADYLEERRKVMQWWADYLLGLGGGV